MSELDNAIKKINNAANRADNTTNFYDNVVSGGKDDVYVNPNNNKSSKSVKGILDEAYQADKPDFTDFVDQCKAEVVNATDQAAIATNQAEAAAHSASQASEISGLDTLASGVGLLSPRIDTPDFLFSCNSGLRVEHGYTDNRNTHGEPVVDFSRASAATSINKSGQLVTLAENEPAIESSGISLFQSLTNLVTYSEDFTIWNKNGTCTITDNQADPFGGNKAFKVFAETANSGVYTSGAITAGDNTYSVWARGIDGEGLRFGSNVSKTITLSFKWKRYAVYLENKGTMTIYADSNNQKFEIYGAQCLRGNIPNAPYIPTNGTAATSAADVAKVTSVNNLPASGKPWYCVVDVDKTSDTTDSVLLSQAKLGVTSGINVQWSSNYDALVIAITDLDGTRHIKSSSDYYLGKKRIIFGCTETELFIYIEGANKLKFTINGWINTLGELFIGSRSGSEAFINGHMKNLIIKHGIMTDDLAKAYGAHPDA